MKSTWQKLSVVVVACMYLLLACGQRQEDVEVADDTTATTSDTTAVQFSEGVIALVNGQAIMEAELARRLRTIIKQAELPSSVDAGTLEQLRNEALEELLENVLIAQVAQQQQIVVTEEEFQQRIRQVQDEYQGQEIAQILQMQKKLYDEWAQSQRDALLLDKVIDVNLGAFLEVTEEEARQYYEQHKDLYDHPDQIRASQILVYDENVAKQALEDIRKGIHFAEVARTYSESSDAENGGDLGFFARGTMPPEFDDVLFSLKLGEVSEVMKTPYGYQIFILTGQRTAHRISFEEAQQQITIKLRRQKRMVAIDLWMAELQKKAKILLNHERIQHVK
jgi:parvulin-like peptidyl-prolyl isomerase